MRYDAIESLLKGGLKKAESMFGTDRNAVLVRAMPILTGGGQTRRLLGKRVAHIVLAQANLLPAWEISVPYAGNRFFHKEAGSNES